MEPPTDPTLAEWWQRLVARLIDGLVLGVFLLPAYVVYVIWLMNRMFEQIDRSMQQQPYGQAPQVPMVISPLESLLFGFGIAMLAAVLGFFYDWLCHGKWGMTLGKRILKIKLVRAADRGPVGGGAAAKRAVAYPLAGVVPMLGSLWGLLDLIWIFTDRERRQCLHDRFAETIVVKTDPPRPPYGPPPGYPPPAYVPGPHGPRGSR